MIEIKNVSYLYKGAEKKSLDGVNLTVRDGEFVLLCGMSGCGKTTLTRLLNGILLNFHDGLYAGQVTVNGLDMNNAPTSESCRIVGSVFQNPRTQFYTMDTTSEVAFGCENLGLPSEEIAGRVSRTFSDLKIENLADRNIFELSGGEKQKLAVASVYAMNPAVYVLDEPSSNLDFTAVCALRETLRLLKAAGKTVVIAEHRLWYLKELIDRAVYMREGRIEREYTAGELSEMSGAQRMETGLRPIELSHFIPARCPAEPGFESIVLDHVQFSYGRKKVLDIENARFRSGCVIAVAGVNGAGKSTFVSLLAGLLKNNKGRFYFDGYPAGHKKRLSESYVVLQEVNHQLFCDSVESEITLGAGDFSPELLEETLRSLNLAELRARHPATLSGGQKQRVILASALFCRKRILIFDEPTSGLDYRHMMQTVQMVGVVPVRGYFVFLITHDYELLSSAADEIVLVKDGKLAEQIPYRFRTPEEMQSNFEALFRP